MPQKGITKYGWIHGGKASMPVPMGASEYLRAKSGRFITNDGLGNGEISGDGSNTIMGFAESGDQQCSSTEGATMVNAIIDLTAIFRIPLRFDAGTYTTNYTKALIGGKFDLFLLNRIQYANVVHTDEETYIVVGGLAATVAVADGAINDALLGDGYVDVMINSTNIHTADS